MSDRLTLLLPPRFTPEEREQAALELCRGSLTEGDGWGGGWHGDGGYRSGDRSGYGDGDGYGWSSGNGRSATSV